MRHKDANQPESVLRSRGYRITPIRTAILAQFASDHRPLSAGEIKDALRRSGFSANKTTVYRELSSLNNVGVVRAVMLGDRTRRYETAESDHHHHLVCVNCKKVEDVSLREDLGSEEHWIAHAKHFKILNHSLEFFGVCAECK